MDKRDPAFESNLLRLNGLGPLFSGGPTGRHHGHHPVGRCIKLAHQTTGADSEIVHIFHASPPEKTGALTIC